MANEDDDDENEYEQEDKETNKPNDKQFNQNGWLSYVDLFAETYRISWPDAFEKPVCEMFSIIRYAKEKAKRQEEAMKRWKMTH